jgi:acyl-CoA synthetase (AMP-forming)/AMP-acid ligase II
VTAGAATLAEALEAAPAGGGELVFHLGDGTERVAAPALLEQARAGAGFLAERGIGRGDGVAVLGPNRPAWARWAYAVWLAGATLVPLPFHLRIRDADAFRRQIASLVRVAGCRAVLADPEFLPFVPPGLGERWDAPAAGSAPASPPAPEDVAVIQFTSGSTAAPKGAVLTHRAVLAGLRASEAASGYRSAGWILLSWLPFFHDWGLFGYLAWAMVFGAQVHVLPTERFARDPSEWLRLVGSVRAQVTPGPSSAWDAALRVAARRPGGIDLSTLRLATMAAEAIDPRVLDRLLRIGGELGLPPEAANGAYGMAEATLAVSVGGPGRISVDAVDRDDLVSRGMAGVAGTGSPARRLVSSGAPVPGMEVRIAGSDGAVAERHVGEILLRGPSLMLGYVGGTDGRDPFPDGWMHTGDLGYLADGELYVTGRSKDVVIVMGRNYPAQDLEWEAERVDGVRAGRTVAFAIEETEGEAVVVVEPASGGDVEALPRAVWRTVADGLGIVPRRVLVLPPGTVPVTTSGKLRRSWVRDAYARGELDRLALSDGPAGAPVPDGEAHP